MWYTYYFDDYEYDYDDYDWDKAAEFLKHKYPLEYFMKIDSEKLYPHQSQDYKDYVYDEFDGYDGTEESIKNMSQEAMEDYIFGDEGSIDDIVWKDDNLQDDLHDFFEEDAYDAFCKGDYTYDWEGDTAYLLNQYYRSVL